MNPQEPTLDAALRAAWGQHHEPGDDYPDQTGPLIVVGPGHDGSVVLGPPRIVDEQRCFAALVPPGVALEPHDRAGFRLVVWHVDPRRTAVNLWREPRTIRTVIALREAQACLLLWAGTKAETQLVVDWLKRRVEHSLAAWKQIVTACATDSGADIVVEAETAARQTLCAADALWGAGWRTGGGTPAVEPFLPASAQRRVPAIAGSSQPVRSN